VRIRVEAGVRTARGEPTGNHTVIICGLLSHPRMGKECWISASYDIVMA
jgi:hypothetical protein